MRRSSRRTIGTVAATLLLLGAAACGDDDTNGNGATGNGNGNGGGDVGSAEDAAAAAQERVDPYLEPADSIGIDEPLDGPIEEGRSVFWLEGNIQSIRPITTGFEDATEAAGWDLTTISYDVSDPQAPGAAMQQAVQGGADYIAVSGQSIDILGEAMTAAQDAGIPVIQLFSTDEVGGEDNGVFGNVGSSESSRASYPLLADLVIADSGGTAEVLLVNVPDFPILQVADEAITSQFESECPECTVTPLDLTIADLTGGTVPSQVVSALQTNPNIEYVFVVIGDLAAGLPEAIDGAGLLDQVKILGNVPNEEQIQSLADGDSFAYLPLPRPFAGWAAVDAMLRLDQGMDVPPEHEVLPIEIWTSETVPQPIEEYEGPEGYQSQFEELWGAGA
jgi:ribose transport system substrate-binding protein